MGVISLEELKDRKPLFHSRSLTPATGFHMGSILDRMVFSRCECSFLVLLTTVFTDLVFGIKCRETIVTWLDVLASSNFTHLASFSPRFRRLISILEGEIQYLDSAQQSKHIIFSGSSCEHL